MRAGPLLVLPTAAALAFAMRGGQAKPKPLPPPEKAEEFRPLAYFAAHCQRCHGPEGNRYPEDFPTRTDAQLRESIVEMAEGPGGAPLGKGGLELQLALHRAIRAKQPFLQISGGENGKALGYASPGAKIVQGGKSVEMKDGRFLAEPKGEIRATRDGKTVKLSPETVGTSHPAEKPRT